MPTRLSFHCWLAPPPLSSHCWIGSPSLCRATVHVEHLPGGSALDLRKAGVGWYHEPLLIVPAPVFAVVLDQHPVAGCAARNIHQFARCQVDESHIAVAGRCDDPLLVPWRRASRVPHLWRPERRSGQVMALLDDRAIVHRSFGHLEEQVAGTVADPIQIADGFLCNRPVDGIIRITTTEIMAGRALVPMLVEQGVIRGICDGIGEVGAGP